MLSFGEYRPSMVSLKAGNWVALSDHVKRGRAKLDLTQRELAELAGVSFATVQSIERAEPRTRIPDSLPKIEIALGWREGTGRKIVEEGLPDKLTRAEVEEMRAELERGGEISEKYRRYVLEYLLDGSD